MKIIGLLSTLLESSSAILASILYTPGGVLANGIGSNAGTTAEVNSGNNFYMEQWTAGASVGRIVESLGQSGTITNTNGRRLA